MTENNTSKRVDNIVRIGPVRFAYVHLDEPRAFDESQTPKYEVTAIIDKKDKDSLEIVRKSYDAAVKNSGLDKRYITPLLRPENANRGLMIDCDKDPRYSDEEEFKGSYILSMKSTNQPIVGTKKYGIGHPLNKEEIQDEIYSGCYGYLIFNFYSYGKKGPYKGIACGINSVYKTRDGEYLGGRSNSLNAFADLDDNSDDNSFDGLDPDDLPF